MFDPQGEPFHSLGRAELPLGPEVSDARQRVPTIKRIRPVLRTGLRCFSFETDFVSNYAVRFLRRKRMVLAPNGRSSNAPAIIVVGSGTRRFRTVSHNSEEVESISHMPLIKHDAVAIQEFPELVLK